jgi:LPS sulfotransferase NodH
MSMVVRMALADRPVALADQAVEAVQNSAELRFVREHKGEDPWFDRPVFIVSPPRSGSTLLFETLAQSANVYTIGDESHALIESIPDLHPAASGYASNRVEAAAATPNVTLALRAGFRAELRDRGGAPPAAARLRMLEKTPKNALRIPLLAKVFPEAHFVYLHRDARAVLASMIEAWTSQRFRTYPKLPAWQGGLSWSLVLTPGWQEVNGRPLHEIVAAQWQQATGILLDDLAALPRERVHIARYDALIADPATEIARLCATLDFVWDQPLAPDAELPLSRYTVSRPDADKWRKHAAEIESVLPRLAATITRAEAFAAR